MTWPDLQGSGRDPGWVMRLARSRLFGPMIALPLPSGRRVDAAPIAGHVVATGHDRAGGTGRRQRRKRSASFSIGVRVSSGVAAGAGSGLLPGAAAGPAEGTSGRVPAEERGGAMRSETMFRNF